MTFDDAITFMRGGLGCPCCACRMRKYEAIAAVVEEVERLRTWDGMLSILDAHWPQSLVPTTHQTDEPKRDPGARIVSLIRWVAELRGDAMNDLETLRAWVKALCQKQRRIRVQGDRDRNVRDADIARGHVYAFDLVLGKIDELLKAKV